MPQALPLIIGLIGATTAAAGTSASIYNSMQGPSAPSPAEVTKQAISDETSKRGTATKEASQFLPMLQSNTGGGLSPDAYRELSANFSGNANLADSSQMKELISKFLGLDTGASFGGTEPFGSSSGGSNPLTPGLTGA